MAAPTLGMCASCPRPGINPFLDSDECLILAGAEETLHGAADVTELETLPRDLQAALFVHSPPQNCILIKSKGLLATDFMEM